MNQIELRNIVLPIREEMERMILRNDYRGKNTCDRVYAFGMCNLYSKEVTKELIRNGFTAITVRGVFDSQSHFWTECGLLIVDITADQFGDYLPRVLIGTYKEYPQYRKI